MKRLQGPDTTGAMSAILPVPGGRNQTVGARQAVGSQWEPDDLRGLAQTPGLLRRSGSVDFEAQAIHLSGRVKPRPRISVRTSIVSTSDRPDLVELTARWRWEAFFRDSERFEDVLEAARQTSAMGRPIPRTLVLLVDDQPVGTASVTAHDLDERPDLTPWLAGVFVAPHARGQGHAARLITAIEREAREASIATLWLYTNTAERVYLRAGWRTVEAVQHDGKPFALMRRDLLPSS